jgi:serine/threonine protein kinase
LSNLELARDLAGRAPTLSSSALEDPSYRCMAPELVRTGEATRESDLFSFGATLFELVSGRPLFERTEDVLRPFEIPPMQVGGQPVPVEVARLADALLAPQPADRPVSAARVVEALDKVLGRVARPLPTAHAGHQPGDCIRDIYELVKHLGEGASGSSWEVKQCTEDSRSPS